MEEQEIVEIIHGRLNDEDAAAEDSDNEDHDGEEEEWDMHTRLSSYGSTPTLSLSMHGMDGLHGIDGTTNRDTTINRLAMNNTSGSPSLNNTTNPNRSSMSNLELMMMTGMKGGYDTGSPSSSAMMLMKGGYDSPSSSATTRCDSPFVGQGISLDNSNRTFDLTLDTSTRSNRSNASHTSNRSITSHKSHTSNRSHSSSVCSPSSVRSKSSNELDITLTGGKIKNPKGLQGLLGNKGLKEQGVRKSTSCGGLATSCGGLMDVLNDDQSFNTHVQHSWLGHPSVLRSSGWFFGCWFPISSFLFLVSYF